MRAAGITIDSIHPIGLALDRFASQLTKLLLHFNDDQWIPATAVDALLAPCTGLRHLALKNIALTTNSDDRSQAPSYCLETLTVRPHRRYGLATAAIVKLAGNSRMSLASFTGESLGARALAALAQAAPNLKEATFDLRSGSDNELATLRQIAGQASVRRVVVRADNRWRDRRGHVWTAAKGRVADAVADWDEASRVKVELAWDEDDDASVNDWDESDF